MHNKSIIVCIEQYKQWSEVGMAIQQSTQPRIVEISNIEVVRPTQGLVTV